jgi:hypothetical protein
VAANLRWLLEIIRAIASHHVDSSLHTRDPRNSGRTVRGCRLLVAVCEEDLEYLEPLVEGCTGAGIRVERLTPEEALLLSPI